MIKKNVSWIILAAGILLIAVGCMLGQPDSVLAKAARICLECVGIG
ncbi:MAG: thioredoxin [Firmicutes bacterium]|nr:thioredoxin [Bacillota bacterium]